MRKCFLLKGDIIYTKTSDKFEVFPNSYLLCENGVSKGIFKTLTDDLKSFPIIDYSNCLIIPGLVDLHIHAPQFFFRGMGMDLQLLEWLDKYTFPIESKYKNLNYANKKYSFFTENLLKSETTRAVLFGTIHTDSNVLLANLLEKTGLKVFLGKVNMNRNANAELTETTENSLLETERFIKEIKDLKNVKPIITPRFVPSCTADLMQELGKIAKDYNIPIQSHLDENLGEVAWVKQLHPECSSYTNVYEKYDLLNDKTIMAHCVHLDEKEQKSFKEKGAFVAHCPQSNCNLRSGIAPIVKYLQDGQKVGLGSDIAAGESLSMFRSASEAIRSSKMRCYYTKEDRPLKISEAFFMATKGGGAFFGKVGSFEEEFEFDAVVIDDKSLGFVDELNLEQRLERVLYLADDRNIKAKYVNGESVL